MALRILHWSDLALTANAVGVEEQVRGLERLVRSQPVDAIAVTGDASADGEAASLSLAAEAVRRVAAASGLAPGRVFVVAGDRDVDRGAARSINAEGAHNLLLAKGRAAVDGYLRSPEQRRAMLARLDRWRAALGALKGQPLAPPWWSAPISHEGRTIGVGGLCSRTAVTDTALGGA